MGLLHNHSAGLFIAIYEDDPDHPHNDCPILDRTGNIMYFPSKADARTVLKLNGFETTQYRITTVAERQIEKDAS